MLKKWVMDYLDWTLGFKDIDYHGVLNVFQGYFSLQKKNMDYF